MNELPPDVAEQMARSYEKVLEWQLDVGEPPGSTGALAMSSRESHHTAEPGKAASGADRPRAEGAPLQPPPAFRIIEAMLFVGGTPLTPEVAGTVIRGLGPGQFQEAMDELNRAYRDQGRPYLIQRQGPGYVLALRPHYRSIADKLYGGVREVRLSSAAIDVLAIVAYRQPVTKQEVDSLRGHESGNLLRQLVRRGLITLVGRVAPHGREVQYGTTSRFLELFGLSSLDDLPRTEDLQQL
jgi:segregation and condensation protein B